EPVAVSPVHLPQEPLPGLLADEDGRTVSGRARVDRARAALDAVLHIERAAGDRLRVHGALEGGEGAEGRDGHRRGGSEAATEGDHRADLEPQGRAVPVGLDRPPDVRVLRVLAGCTLNEPRVV